MSVVQALRFPVHVRWRGGRISGATALDKPYLEIATPPEFPGGVEGVWSPEELLVSAVASCYALTLAAIADRLGIPLVTLDAGATGHVSRREDGRYGFVAIEVDVSIETTPGSEQAAVRAAHSAETRCIVTMALDVPVRVRAVAHAATPSQIAAV